MFLSKFIRHVISSTNCQIWMRIIKLSILFDKIFIFIMDRLRKHNNPITLEFFDYTISKILVEPPNISEITSTMQQYHAILFNLFILMCKDITRIRHIKRNLFQKFQLTLPY